jgi:hypothetical protein
MKNAKMDIEINDLLREQNKVARDFMHHTHGHHNDINEKYEKTKEFQNKLRVLNEKITALNQSAQVILN